MANGLADLFSTNLALNLDREAGVIPIDRDEAVSDVDNRGEVVVVELRVHGVRQDAVQIPNDTQSVLRRDLLIGRSNIRPSVIVRDDRFEPVTHSNSALLPSVGGPR